MPSVRLSAIVCSDDDADEDETAAGTAVLAGPKPPWPMAPVSWQCTRVPAAVKFTFHAG